MKKFISIFIVFCFVLPLFSEENVSANQENLNVPKIENNALSPKKDWFMVFDWGFMLGRVTKIQEQTGKSNFVWKDSLMGGFITANFFELFPVESSLRLQIFYPFLNQFNGMKQFSKQTVVYGVDLFMGPNFEKIFMPNFSVKFTPGIHYMYHISDEYHWHYAGAGLVLGARYKLGKPFSIMLDGSFTFDNANLGTNKKIRPIDWCWSWQASLGFRYSKKIAGR